MNSVVETFTIGARCKKSGHETQPITFVCSIGTCKDRLACPTCAISNHSNHGKNLIPIRNYLNNYIGLDAMREQVLKDNLLFEQGDANSKKLADDRKVFEANVQNAFVDIMKLSKIAYENAREKFLMQSKQVRDSIDAAIEESKQMASRKEPSVKEMIQTCQGNNFEQLEGLCENLLKQTSLNSVQSFEVKEKLKDLVSFDNNKFNEVREEILQFIQTKLKNLLIHHGIKMVDLSWHSRSTEQLKVYVGHTDHVLDMTVLPDGTLVSASKDKTLRFWDTSSHHCVQTNELFDKNLNAVCTMPDGSIAVARDNLIKFINQDRNELEKALTGHTKTILALQPLPDGNLASAGQDRVIKLWNVKTGQLLRSFYGHDDYIRRLYLTKDNKLISASDDKTVKIWDLRTGEILNSLESNNDYVYALSVMKNGFIVTGSRDGVLQIWDPDYSCVVQKIQAHNTYIYCLAILQDGTIATGSADNSIKLWDPKTGEMLRRLEGHKFPVKQLVVLQDGNLASCGEDNMIIIWASRKLEVIHTFTHNKAVWDVAALPGNRFVSASEDTTLKVWDGINGGNPLATKTDHTDQVRAVIYLGNNQFASGSSDKTIRIWSSVDYSLIRVLNGHLGGVRSLSVASDQPGRLVSGSEDKTVKVWEISSGDCIQTLSGHDDYVRVVKALTSGRIASGSRDNTLRIWSLASQQVECVLKGHQLPIWSILELESGKRMATGSSDYSIRIWNMENHKTVTTLYGHSGPVWCLCKQSDSVLMSGSEDCMLRLWDWQAGSCIRSLLSHSYAIWGIAIDESSNVASGSWDKTVKIWNVKRNN